jgi:hypothetical protein
MAPSVEDFKSNEALGVQPHRPLTGLALECWNGVSAWETLEQPGLRSEAGVPSGPRATILSGRSPKCYSAASRLLCWSIQLSSMEGRGDEHGDDVPVMGPSVQ